jgi:hypothetical protein
MSATPQHIGETEGARLGMREAWRSSLPVAVLVAPLNLISLGFLTLPLAVWLIARRFARRYRRQMTPRETRLLAAASWTWMLLPGLIDWVTAGAPFALLLLLLPWRVIDFLMVWAAYLWLARYVVNRTLLLQPAPRTEPASASQLLDQQAEGYEEATARTLTLAAAWLPLGAAGIFLFVLLSAALGIVLTLLGVPLDAGTWMAGSVSIALPALMSGWAYFISRKAAEVFPSHHLVLWLRRFHRADLMEFPFPYLLERACRGIAVPITLQDSTVPRARTAAELRPAFHVQRAALIACWFGFLAALAGLFGRASWTDAGGLLLAVAAVLAAGAMIALAVLVHGMGVVKLGTRRGERSIRQLLDAIDSEAGVPQTLTIVSTPDETWRSWVLEFVGRADAVLVDVTHLSPNLHWELGVLRERLQPKQLILAYGSRDGDGSTIPPDVQGQLESLLGAVTFERSQRFFYRLERGGVMSRLRSVRSSGRGWVPLDKARRSFYSRQLVAVLHEAFGARAGSV